MNTQEQITIPRETFDQMKRALEEACGNRCNAEYNPCYASKALTAANAVPKPTVPDNSQEWKGMDGTTAFHLITRHADGWADVGKMMGEWLAANREVQPQAQGDAL